MYFPLTTNLYNLKIVYITLVAMFVLNIMTL